MMFLRRSVVVVAAALLGAAAFVDAFSATPIKPNAKLPAVNLHFGFPPQMVNLGPYAGDKNMIIVGLPGAVPGYLEKQDALKEAGIDEVLVYCVNDGAVMKAWAADQGVEGSMVTFMGDPSGEFTKAVGMEMTHPGPASVGIIGRCKRFAMVVVKGVVKYVAVSEGPDDPAGDDDPSATCVEAMLAAVAMQVA